MNIHPTAIVHPDAQLADDVEVQPYSIIGSQVRIGAGTVIGPHCVLDGITAIGERNRLYGGAQVGIPSQDLKHNHEFTGRTVIGDDNIIRELVTITSSTVPKEEERDRLTSVGNGCLLMTYVHIGHDCHIGNGVILASYVGLSGHVDIHDCANVGGQSGVHQFVTIGSYAFCGGMARIRKDAMPYMSIDGDPCRCLGPNYLGLERGGFDEAARARIKQMYKILCRSHLNATQALEEIERSVDDSDERKYFLEFFRNSKRGVTI